MWKLFSKNSVKKGCLELEESSNEQARLHHSTQLKTPDTVH